MDGQTIVIKKYENRRLYDTTNSRYVNLDDVAQLIREGVEVKVVDAGSGEDLTRLVLTQIIAEDAKAPNSVFPLDILRQMVIASGRASQEGFLRYMKAMTDMYQNTYRTFVPTMTPFDFMHAMMPGAGARSTSPAPPPSAAAATDPTPPDAGSRTDQTEVNELRRRLEELEKIIAARAAAPERSGRQKNAKRRR